MRKMRTKTAKGEMIYIILLILLKLIKLTSCKDEWPLANWLKWLRQGAPQATSQKDLLKRGYLYLHQNTQVVWVACNVCFLLSYFHIDRTDHQILGWETISSKSLYNTQTHTQKYIFRSIQHQISSCTSLLQHTINIFHLMQTNMYTVHVDFMRANPLSIKH